MRLKSVAKSHDISRDCKDVVSISQPIFCLCELDQTMIQGGGKANRDTHQSITVYTE